ncbi:GATA zinc finger domain-containing protein [Mycena chlorophos]|uniref:GATA zinc finger domain-containing protein n=1 Tax=Mycena chlorophos TaxID=658473 RepID=A0A8H6TAX7_MYCCL|nr:GATA zinc finger domain-containing protein [Mycena chlorophos]
MVPTNEPQPNDAPDPARLSPVVTLPSSPASLSPASQHPTPLSPLPPLPPPPRLPLPSNYEREDKKPALLMSPPPPQQQQGPQTHYGSVDLPPVLRYWPEEPHSRHGSPYSRLTGMPSPASPIPPPPPLPGVVGLPNGGSGGAGPGARYSPPRTAPHSHRQNGGIDLAGLITMQQHDPAASPAPRYRDDGWLSPHPSHPHPHPHTHSFAPPPPAGALATTSAGERTCAVVSYFSPMAGPSALPPILPPPPPPPSTSRRSGSSANSANNAGPKKECFHCHATSTPLWRREPNTQKPLCNACGLYLQQRNKLRPQELIDADRDTADDEINRIPDSEYTGPKCSHCGTRQTSVWRRSKEGRQVCNACGVYQRLKGKERPLSLRRNKIKPRTKHTR